MKDDVCSDVVNIADIITIGNQYLHLVIFMHIARENHVFENLQLEKWTAWLFMVQNMEWKRQGFSTRFYSKISHYRTMFVCNVCQ